MLVAQHAYTARLHHQGKGKVERVAQPALGESPGQMAVGNEDNVAWVFAVHVGTLDVLDARNERVDARGYLGGRLAVFAAVAPNVPRVRGRVQALFFPQLPDFFRL